MSIMIEVIDMSMNYIELCLLEQLQNTPQLIYMSLNKNSVYCVMPRSSKPPDTCKWGGPELRGILKFSQKVKLIHSYGTRGNLTFRTKDF